MARIRFREQAMRSEIPGRETKDAKPDTRAKSLHSP
ncbi:MAG: hypothetical protein IPN69_01530 [Acidobacteria bacterium]|nr:hypothetical protein [Acidobacteriota bacterium]MBK8151058.1 hypothetical protein [Acidobacteriota bacterium]MBK8809401.1 hypothetical protein [Acidobacteriota bacterium]